MGLSSSMWSSVSGLLTHGEKMNVVGNNIANVNTVGFKGQRMDFADYMYQDSNSLSGVTQVGRGVGIGALLGDFSQASFEMTNEATDMGVAGRGFFQVKDPYSDQVWYTRAGNFRFNKEGTLENPQGYALQGWKIDNRDGVSLATGSGAIQTSKSPLRGSGSPVDIKLDSWTAPPKATSRVSFQVQFDSSPGKDNSIDATSPMTSLLKAWDGKQPKAPDAPPMPQGSAAGSSTITVYDEGGSARTLTVYFDQVSAKGPNDAAGKPTYEIKNLPNGDRVYEYVVTMDPAQDLRTYGGTYDPATGSMTGAKSFQDSKMAGVLMTGTVTFNSAGQMVSQSAYTYGANYDGTATPNTAYAGDPDKLTSWQPTKMSSNGYPLFCPNFTGRPMENTLGDRIDPDGTTGPATTINNSVNRAVELNLGIKSTNPVNPWGANGAKTLDDLKLDYSAVANADPAKREDNASISYAADWATKNAQQNGYSYGNLTSYDVDKEGILYGMYSNGVTLPLYQVAMHDFTNLQGLRRDGGNLYSATQASGSPSVGTAGQGGMGSINAYSVEQSNVDMAREFVQMITTQRGFQANSKGITTVDMMLEQVINMKR